MYIKKITRKKALKILSSARKEGMYKPLGLFYLKYKDPKIYIGIDNSKGYCNVEEFKSFKKYKNWLNGLIEKVN